MGALLSMCTVGQVNVKFYCGIAQSSLHFVFVYSSIVLAGMLLRASGMFTLRLLSVMWQLYIDKSNVWFDAARRCHLELHHARTWAAIIFTECKYLFY